MDSNITTNQDNSPVRIVYNPNYQLPSFTNSPQTTGRRVDHEFLTFLGWGDNQD